jgi:hypothetical protein
MEDIDVHLNDFILTFQSPVYGDLPPLATSKCTRYLFNDQLNLDG